MFRRITAYLALVAAVAFAGHHEAHASQTGDFDLRLDSASIHHDVSLILKALSPDSVGILSLPESNPANWWLSRLKHRGLDTKDSTAAYPRFLRFCLGVYNWADEFFNGTDREYVEGTGKRWKARIVSDNWDDGYAIRLPNDFRIVMLTHVYANVGAYLQYMALSLGYTYNTGVLFGLNPLHHKKFEFGFSSARFNLEVYRQDNHRGTNIRKFGKIFGGKTLDEPFHGVDLRVQGTDAMYFLNHKKYSYGAAYNYSKLQKKSQGSAVLGLSYTNFDLSMDFGKLTDNLKEVLPIPAEKYRVNYNSIGVIAGYGFNWVISPRLVFNITAAPSFGAVHCLPDNLGGEKWMFGIKLRGRSALTYNIKNWFFSGNARFTGHYYPGGDFSLFTNIVNFSFNAGIRF